MYCIARIFHLKDSLQILRIDCKIFPANISLLKCTWSHSMVVPVSIIAVVNGAVQKVNAMIRGPVRRKQPSNTRRERANCEENGIVIAIRHKFASKLFPWQSSQQFDDFVVKSHGIGLWLTSQLQNVNLTKISICANFKTFANILSCKNVFTVCMLITIWTECCHA